MQAVKEKEFEERVRYLGAKYFGESGSGEHEFDFLGVKVHYMVAHGKGKKREVPIGGPLGINYVAKKMAEIAKSHNFPHGGDATYFKKGIKGYTPIKHLKRLENGLSVLIIIFASVSISLAFFALSNKITGYTALNTPSNTSKVGFFVVFLIAAVIISRLFFRKK